MINICPEQTLMKRSHIPRFRTQKMLANDPQRFEESFFNFTLDARTRHQNSNQMNTPAIFTGINSLSFPSDIHCRFR